jgi:hypothetical protein
LFFCHWYLKGAVPVVATKKVAVCPTVTPTLTGCVVMDGAADAPFPLGLPLVLVRPAHPARMSPPDRTKNKRNLIF